MNERVLAGLVFTAFIFIIPLFALNGQKGDIPMLPVQTASMQESKEDTASKPVEPPPAQRGAENVPQEAPSASAPAPAVQVDDDGFTILDEQTGRRFHVTAQDYVRGSLAAEMPPNFHPEALKAQAVAAHTYALCKKAQNDGLGEDFTADPENWKTYTTEKLFRKRYGQLADAYWQSICQAADAVTGYVMTYEGEPIVAAYHSMSSGVTEDAANVWMGGEPYLVPVESPGDKLAPDYATKETFTADQVALALRQQYPDIELAANPAEWFEVTGRSEGGYVTEVQAGDLQIHGKELRSLLGLRSSDFEITWAGSKFTFAVKGYGHGVGLSQYGADYMARQGATFDEILTHYYPGASLAVISK